MAGCSSLLLRVLRERWRRAAGLALGLVLAGCASAPGTPPAPLPLADALFAAPARPPSAAAVMALDQRMRALLDQSLRRETRQKGPQRALLDLLYGDGRMMLDYDASYTRNAAEAYADRVGNCLSLVLMTAAFAREIGLAVRFNEVQVDESWRMSGDLMLRSGHVNLTLGLRPSSSSWRADDDSALRVDFLPPGTPGRLRSRPIDESTVLAMYFNNRAAESIAAGRVDDAYWFARASLLQDGRFEPALNTLGVVYLRAGQLALADRALSQALASEPADSSAISNLALVRDAQGRDAEAAALRARRAALEPSPPRTVSCAPRSTSSAALPDRC